MSARSGGGNDRGGGNGGGGGGGAGRSRTLAPLVATGALQAGVNFLSCSVAGREHFAELAPDGAIHFEGYVFKSPSAFSVYVKRKQNPSRKADDGWTSCKYRGTLLSLYRPRLEELIASGLGNAPALPGGGGASTTPKTSSPKQSRPRPRGGGAAHSSGTAIDSELAGNMTMGGGGGNGNYASYDSDDDGDGGRASVGNGTILSRSPPRGGGGGATSNGGGVSLSRRGSLGPAGGGGGNGGGQKWPGSPGLALPKRAGAAAAVPRPPRPGAGGGAPRAAASGGSNAGCFAFGGSNYNSNGGSFARASSATIADNIGALAVSTPPPPLSSLSLPPSATLLNTASSLPLPLPVAPRGPPGHNALAWVQCEEPACLKWRRLRARDVPAGRGAWRCSMNPDGRWARCSVPQASPDDAADRALEARGGPLPGPDGELGKTGHAEACCRPGLDDCTELDFEDDLLSFLDASGEWDAARALRARRVSLAGAPLDVFGLYREVAALGGLARHLLPSSSSPSAVTSPPSAAAGATAAAAARGAGIIDFAGIDFAGQIFPKLRNAPSPAAAAAAAAAGAPPLALPAAVGATLLSLYRRYLLAYEVEHAAFDLPPSEESEGTEQHRRHGAAVSAGDDGGEGEEGESDVAAFAGGSHQRPKNGGADPLAFLADVASAGEPPMHGPPRQAVSAPMGGGGAPFFASWNSNGNNNKNNGNNGSSRGPRCAASAGGGGGVCSPLGGADVSSLPPGIGAGGTPLTPGAGWPPLPRAPANGAGSKRNSNQDQNGLAGNTNDDDAASPLMKRARSGCGDVSAFAAAAAAAAAELGRRAAGFPTATAMAEEDAAARDAADEVAATRAAAAAVTTALARIENSAPGRAAPGSLLLVPDPEDLNRHWPVVVAAASDLPLAVAAGGASLRSGGSSGARCCSFPQPLHGAAPSGRVSDAYPVVVLGSRDMGWAEAAACRPFTPSAGAAAAAAVAPAARRCPVACPDSDADALDAECSRALKVAAQCARGGPAGRASARAAAHSAGAGASAERLLAAEGRLPPLDGAVWCAHLEFWAEWRRAAACAVSAAELAPHVLALAHQLKPSVLLEQAAATGANSGSEGEGDAAASASAAAGGVGGGDAALVARVTAALEGVRPNSNAARGAASASAATDNAFSGDYVPALFALSAGGAPGGVPAVEAAISAIEDAVDWARLSAASAASPSSSPTAAVAAVNDVAPVAPSMASMPPLPPLRGAGATATTPAATAAMMMTPPRLVAATTAAATPEPKPGVGGGPDAASAAAAASAQVSPLQQQHQPITPASQQQAKPMQGLDEEEEAAAAGSGAVAASPASAEDAATPTAAMTAATAVEELATPAEATKTGRTKRSDDDGNDQDGGSGNGGGHGDHPKDLEGGGSGGGVAAEAEDKDTPTAADSCHRGAEAAAAVAAAAIAEPEAPLTRRGARAAAAAATAAAAEAARMSSKNSPLQAPTADGASADAGNTATTPLGTDLLESLRSMAESEARAAGV